MSSKVAEKGSLESVRNLLKFLDVVPQQYKVGPWSPAAHITIFAYAAFIFLSMSYAVKAYTPPDYTQIPNDWIQTYRLVGALYGFALTALVYYASGIWMLGSYTLTSWNLMSLRLFSSYLAGHAVPGAGLLADLLRYPSLIGCTVTVTVWWIILVPLIDFLLSQGKSREDRIFFWKWNLAPVLINVHLLNLPIIAIDFLASGVALTFFDLWVALTVAFLYCMFYLNVLDPRGLHFYIIFSPRTVYCAISYALILSGYYGFYQAWNYLLLEYPI